MALYSALQNSKGTKACKCKISLPPTLVLFLGGTTVSSYMGPSRISIGYLFKQMVVDYTYSEIVLFFTCCVLEIILQ